MGHENHSLGAMVNGIFDRWNGTSDTLVISDILVGVEGDIEVYLA
jgi:hypothetical protein